MHRLSLVAAWCGVLVSQTASAATVTLGAARDNTLYENNSGALSNGAGEYLFAGRSLQGDGADRKRGLLAFDVAAWLPAGSTVQGATLTLHMSRSNPAGPTMVTLHRVLADWGEGDSATEFPSGGGTGAPAEPGDATWLHRFWNTDFWTSAGGDFDPAASGTTLVEPQIGFYTWSSSQMAADVQSWLDDPASDFGWLLMGDESFFPTAKRYDTRENATPEYRPQLTIEFTPPAEAGACCLADGSCLVLEATQCGGLGGDFQGMGTGCEPNLCPQPTGACCFVDGSCQSLGEAECAGQGGFYQGDDAPCDPDPCVDLSGACCFSGAACEALLLGECLEQGGTFQGPDVACAPGACPLALEPFVDPLPIPPLAQPVSGVAGGAASYEIAMSQFQQQLHRDLSPTTVWGYDGVYPGPVIAATTGEPVEVTWINDLRDGGGVPLTEHPLPVDTCPHGAENLPKTVVHLHGGHVPADVDGYPEDAFLPAEQVTYVYPNQQLPALIWFHDHALGITRLNVYMGLAGAYLVSDAFEQGLDLPAGDFEIPLIVQDRSFEIDGSLAYPADWQEHFFGEYILVNGMVWPYLEVNRGKYRFRVLNGSNSRTYTFWLDAGKGGAADFQQIGTDGGLLAAPVTLSELTLAPGERADLVIDFEPYADGTELVLRNSAPAPYPGTPGMGVVPDVMQFRVSDPTGHTDPLPTELRAVAPLLEEDTIREREFVLSKEDEACAGSHWLINGLRWDDITEYPQLGTTEVWSFINQSGIMHPMHLHLDFFQILDRQAFELVEGEIVPTGPRVPPAPNEAGWKDTAQVAPMEILRVVAQFTDYTGKYPYHCHILEHEDHEMMRQFHVVDCPADTNGDGGVNVQDLVAIILAWNTADPATDTNADGIVDVQDLIAVIVGWGSCVE